MIGTRLGAYDVLAKLGAGGMGEVYRARDSKLGREVALKVVLDAFVADRDRQTRFEREARALAALNHPHIATLHGMEAAEGRHFLVMELVEGPTLQDVIERDGPSGLPIERAIAIAIQIADALDAAHEKGIVHRDLKPANVKVAPDDKVKVLDFGLAKSLAATRDQPGPDGDRSSPSWSLASSPTMTNTATAAGMILGTASYMSPEQARGQGGDHRSDIFSFGVVLFEMLAGAQPFGGETVSDVLASVLAKDPDLSKLPAGLSPRLTDLVQRCLEKHPKRRWQAIGDVRHELEVIARNPRGGDAATTMAAPAARQPLWRRAMPAIASALLASAATAAVSMMMRDEPSSVSGVSHFAVPYPAGHARAVFTRPALAISPDGTRLAFVADRDMYIRDLANPEPRMLPRPEAGNLLSTPMNLVFSPDGNSLAYWDLADSNIRRIDLSGGAAFTIARAANSNGLSWQGDYLYFASAEGIARVRASGGSPEIVIKSEPNVLMTAPQILDDGRLLYSIAPPGDAGADRWNAAMVVVQRPGDPSSTTLVEGGSDPRYLPSGHLVYQSGGALIARRYDVRSGALANPIAVVNGVLRGSQLISSGTAWYGVSTTGTLVYVPGPLGNSSQVDVRLGWFDRAGKFDALPIPAGPYGHPRVSRDGRRLAFSRADGGGRSIWVYEFDGGGLPRRLTFGGRDQFPIWSGDSQWVIFQSQRDGDVSIHRQRADGSGTVERLTTAPPGTSDIPATAAPDGSLLLFNRMPGTGQDERSTLMAYSFADGTTTAYRGITSALIAGVEFSPDGKWLLYATSEPVASFAFIPYVEPYPATGAKFQIATFGQGGHSPTWSADGREVYYTPGPGSVMQVVRVTTSPSFSFGRTEPVARPFVNPPPTDGRPFDVGPQRLGGRILGMVPESVADPTASSRDEIRVVLNWIEELKLRVP